MPSVTLSGQQTYIVIFFHYHKSAKFWNTFYACFVIWNFFTLNVFVSEHVAFSNFRQNLKLWNFALFSVIVNLPISNSRWRKHQLLNFPIFIFLRFLRLSTFSGNLKSAIFYNIYVVCWLILIIQNLMLVNMLFTYVIFCEFSQKSGC